MSAYENMRHFADSWGLLAMVLIFLGVVFYTLRPGSRKTHDDIADIPFRHGDRPAAADADAEALSKAPAKPSEPTAQERRG